MLIYNLIPKGGDIRLPPLTTPMVYGSQPQRRLAVMGAGELPPQSALCADSSPIRGAECPHPLVSAAASVGSGRAPPGRRTRSGS